MHPRYDCDKWLSERDQEIARLKAALALVEAERAEARTFGEIAAHKYNDLLQTCAENTAVTCAFCGAVYPAGTPRHGDGRLAEHIKVCSQHPMRELEQKLAQAETERDTLREFRTAVSVTLSLSGPDDGAEELAMIAWLQTQLAQAEQALRAVEWFDCGTGYAWCPWCWAVYAEGTAMAARAHDDSCPRQVALCAIEGKS